MILVDANLLVYAVNTAAPEHDRSRRWLAERLDAPARVALPWASLLAFVRLASNPRVLARPITVAEAWRTAKAWLAIPAVWTPQPTERHAEVLDSMLAVVSDANLVPDAHLAALAVEHGLTLASTDTDFARFPQLRFENPLA